MTKWCLIPSLIFYGLASLLYLAIFFKKSFEKSAHILIFFGAFLQGIYIGYSFFSEGRFLILNSVSLGMVVYFLWLVWRHRWEALGPFFVPLSFMLLLFSLKETHYFSFRLSLLSIHIIFAGFSFLFMLGAFILGLVFFVHERKLKQKSSDLFQWQFPPLILNEKKALIWLKLGFVFLTIVLVTGSMLMGHISVSFPWDVFHVLLALVGWMIYAIILNRRWMGLGGHKILLLSFLGFVSLVSSFLWN